MQWWTKSVYCAYTELGCVHFKRKSQFDPHEMAASQIVDGARNRLQWNEDGENNNMLLKIVSGQFELLVGKKGDKETERERAKEQEKWVEIWDKHIDRQPTTNYSYHLVFFLHRCFCLVSIGLLTFRTIQSWYDIESNGELSMKNGQNAISKCHSSDFSLLREILRVCVCARSIRHLFN